MRRTVPIEEEDLARLQRLQRATRLPRRVILGSALLGWERSHCPPETLSGVEMACAERQEKLLASLESIREPNLLPVTTAQFVRPDEIIQTAVARVVI